MACCPDCSTLTVADRNEIRRIVREAAPRAQPPQGWEMGLGEPGPPLAVRRDLEVEIPVSEQTL